MKFFRQTMRYIGVLFFGSVLSFMVDAQESPMQGQTDQIILGGGCFWCIEAVYERIDGVSSAVSGYSGGTTVQPTYKEVVRGDTGHIEVVQVTFDPSVISLEDILDWFWRAHDPTSKDRQGADVGIQYRSVVFYTSDEQKDRINASLKQAQTEFSRSIVTEVRKLDQFYIAEGYHQDYYDKNKFAGYCQLVIRPKLKKLSLDG